MSLRARVVACFGVVLGCAALLVGLLAGERVLQMTHAGHTGTPFLLLTAVAFATALLLGVAGIVCLYAATRSHSPGDAVGTETHHHRAVTL